MPTSPTTLAHPSTRSVFASTPSAVTRGRSLLAPLHNLSSPAGVSAVCAPCAASIPSTPSTGGHEGATASATQPFLEATILFKPPPVGSRRQRSPSPTARTTQPRSRAHA
eukprot:2622727-Pleurochrysis_carterae.AAC.1